MRPSSDPITRERGVSDRFMAMMLVVCLDLAAYHAWRRPTVWHARRD